MRPRRQVSAVFKMGSFGKISFPPLPDPTRPREAGPAPSRPAASAESGPVAPARETIAAPRTGHRSPCRASTDSRAGPGFRRVLGGQWSFSRMRFAQPDGWAGQTRSHPRTVSLSGTATSNVGRAARPSSLSAPAVRALAMEENREDGPAAPSYLRRVSQSRRKYAPCERRTGTARHGWQAQAADMPTPCRSPFPVRRS